MVPGVQVSVLCADADLQDGHVLRANGQPPAQRGQTDAVCEPTDALRRLILIHLSQPAALPLQLPLHGSPSPGQSVTLMHRKTIFFIAAFYLHHHHHRDLFQMPHEVLSQSPAKFPSSVLAVRNNTHQ